MLAPIRGTNQYWFRVKGEVKAMIAEYGSPTLFVTLIIYTLLGCLWMCVSYIESLWLWSLVSVVLLGCSL